MYSNNNPPSRGNPTSYPFPESHSSAPFPTTTEQLSNASTNDSDSLIERFGSMSIRSPSQLPAPPPTPVLPSFMSAGQTGSAFQPAALNYPRQPGQQSIGTSQPFAQGQIPPPPNAFAHHHSSNQRMPFPANPSFPPRQQTSNNGLQTQSFAPIQQSFPANQGFPSSGTPLPQGFPSIQPNPQNFPMPKQSGDLSRGFPSHPFASSGQQSNQGFPPPIPNPAKEDDPNMGTQTSPFPLQPTKHDTANKGFPLATSTTQTFPFSSQDNSNKGFAPPPPTTTTTTSQTLPLAQSQGFAFTSPTPLGIPPVQSPKTSFGSQPDQIKGFASAQPTSQSFPFSAKIEGFPPQHAAQGLPFGQKPELLQDHDKGFPFGQPTSQTLTQPQTQQSSFGQQPEPETRRLSLGQPTSQHRPQGFPPAKPTVQEFSTSQQTGKKDIQGFPPFQPTSQGFPTPQSFPFAQPTSQTFPPPQQSGKQDSQRFPFAQPPTSQEPSSSQQFGKPDNQGFPFAQPTSQASSFSQQIEKQDNQGFSFAQPSQQVEKQDNQRFSFAQPTSQASQFSQQPGKLDNKGFPFAQPTSRASPFSQQTGKPDNKGFPFAQPTSQASPFSQQLGKPDNEGFPFAQPTSQTFPPPQQSGKQDNQGFPFAQPSQQAEKQDNQGFPFAQPTSRASPFSQQPGKPDNQGFPFAQPTSQTFPPLQQSGQQDNQGFPFAQTTSQGLSSPQQLGKQDNQGFPFAQPTSQAFPFAQMTSQGLSSPQQLGKQDNQGFPFAQPTSQSFPFTPPTPQSFPSPQQLGKQDNQGFPFAQPTSQSFPLAQQLGKPGGQGFPLSQPSSQGPSFSQNPPNQDLAPQGFPSVPQAHRESTSNPFAQQQGFSFAQHPKPDDQTQQFQFPQLQSQQNRGSPFPVSTSTLFAPKPDQPPPPFPPDSATSFNSSANRFGHGSANQQLPPQPNLRPQLGQFQPPSHCGLNAEQLPNYVEIKTSASARFSNTIQPTLSQPPAVPPPAVVVPSVAFCDTGNCSPRYIRSTSYLIPTTSDFLKQSQFPLALALAPMAEPNHAEEPLGCTRFPVTPVRCHRCNAYMCPWMKFQEGGNRFLCPMCESVTDTPGEYFAHTDYEGKRADQSQRPELCRYSYEIVATNEYCKNNELPQSAVFFFLVDITYASVRSGLLKVFCENLIENILAHLPLDPYKQAEDRKSSPVQVCLIAYDSRLHFFRSDDGEVDCMVVPDTSTVFLPDFEGLLIPSEEISSRLKPIIEKLPAMFEQNQSTEASAFVSAVKTACELLREFRRIGKIFILNSSMTPDCSPKRNDQRALGTDKEKSVLCPGSKIYAELGSKCVEVGCSVELFLFPNQFVDVSTIGELCRVSSGHLHMYRYFTAETDTQRFISDLKRSVAKTTAYDVSMRVRTSKGLRPTDFVGNVDLVSVSDMEFGSIDCDTSILVEIKHDDKIEEGSTAYFQAALLYTSVGGLRLIRIHNLQLPTCSNVSKLFANFDFETVAAYITKVAVRSMQISPYKTIRQNILAQLAQLFACYRSNSANPGSSSNLVLPESLKLLPVLINSLLRSDALIGSQNVSVDTKSYLLRSLMSMTTSDIIQTLYPTLISVLEDGQPELRCCMRELRPDRVLMLDNGFDWYVWIGSGVSMEARKQVLGAINGFYLGIASSDANEIYEKTSKLLNSMMNRHKRFLKIITVVENDSQEIAFKNQMVEENGFVQGGTSYTQFIIELHKEIGVSGGL